MRAHKLLSQVVVALCALVAAFAVSCVPAGAEVTHKFLSSITEVPASSGAAETGPLGFVSSVAVDSGELYVAPNASPETRVSKFNASSGAFISQFPEVSPPLEYVHQGIAVGHSSGEINVYVGGDELVAGPQGIVAVYDPTGTLKTVWKGTETPAKAFGCFKCSNSVVGAAEGDIAVDNSPSLGWAAGDVYVVDVQNAVVDVFSSTAGTGEKYVTQLTGVGPGEPFTAPQAVAVDGSNGEIMVVNGTTEVDMFKPAALAGQYEFVGRLTQTPQGQLEHVSGVTTDAKNGDIYVAESGRGVIYEFDSQGTYIGRLEPSSGAKVVAVDPTTEQIYVGTTGAVDIFGPNVVIPDVTTGPASSPVPESATLNGTVNPDKAGSGQTTCQFVWGTSESFGHVLPCPAPVAEGESPAPVSAVLEGLEPDTTYYFRLQASNANGTNEGAASQTLHFTTPGPGIAEESVHSISSTSATLGASIDPHGSGTTYYFQYGTTSTYGSEAPASPGISIGAGQGHNEETQHLQGLSSNTTYHYRAVAVSNLEVEPGVFKEVSFDGHDQTFTTQTIGGSLVLPDGRAWELVSPADKHGAIIPSIDEQFNPDHVIKASESGDAMTYATTSPTEEGASGYAEGEQQIFSKRGPDGWSSQDIALPHRRATDIAFFVGGEYRMFSEDLSFGLVTPLGEFTSLGPEVTPPDTERTPYLRHDDTCSTQPSSCYLPLLTEAPGYADVSPGTVFGDPGKTFDEAVTIVGASPDLSHVLLSSTVALTSGSAGGIYEWSSGKPPAEELQPIEGGSVAGLSEDGSHVILANKGHLYRRDMPGGGTVQLDEVQPGASGAGTASATFQGENSDGSIVYFTDGQSLTKDSVGGDDDLYECRIDETAGDKCDLTDIVHTVSGLDVLGASKDTAYVYFVSSDVLSNQTGSDGEKAVAGADNLYELHEGAIRLIAIPNQGSSTRVTPDGNYLAFGSHKSLTGYDNAEAEELFLFNSATDRLVCASCNPSGTRPEGSSSFPVERSLSSPGKPRYLSSNGQLFFDSTEALAPQDINKNMDVYEYEMEGVGSCSASSVNYNERSGGCVGLISSGTAPGQSEFLDASENGDDVFFTTQEKLVAGDVDTAVDVYDAHACSAAVPCSVVPASLPPCVTADACRSAPSPQPAVFGSPASATFVGAGNVTSKLAPAAKPKSLTRAQKLARALKICRRKTKHKRAACERKARKQYSSKPAHRARVTKGGRG